MKQCFAILPIAVLSLMVAAADQPNQPNQDNRDPNNNTANRDQFNRDQDNRDQNTAQDQQKGPKQADLSYRQRVVTGKVLDTKEADVTAEGKTEKHFLAKVQTLENFPVIVDFGPKEKLKSEINKDDEIAAFGIAGRMNKKPLVFASKFAMITPIDGRDEIFESVPVSFNGQNENANQAGNQAQNSSQQLGQQAFQGDPNFDPRVANQGGNYNGDPRMNQGGNYGGDPRMIQGGNYNGDPRMMNQNFQPPPFRTASDCGCCNER